MQKFLTFLGVAFASGLAAISIGANFWFGTLLTAGAERWLYGAVFALLDGLKTVLVPLAAAALAAGLRTKAAAAIAVFVVLTVRSFTAEIGLYAHTKSEVVGDARAAHQRYADARAAKARADADLAAIGAVRPAGDVAAEIGALRRDRLYDRSKQCAEATAPDSRELCARLDRLAGELAKAQEAARLRHAADAAAVALSKLDVAAAMRSVDPQAEALAKLLGIVVAVEPETVRTGLAVLIALLVEIGSGLGPWLATPSRRATPEPAAGPEAARPAAGEASAEAQAPEPAAAAPAPSAAADGAGAADGVVERWAAEALVRRRGSALPAAEARSSFEAWCMTEGLEPMNPTAFGRAMTAAGHRREKVGGVMRYLDLALAAPAIRPQLRVAVDNGPARRVLGRMARGG